MRLLLISAFAAVLTASAAELPVNNPAQLSAAIANAMPGDVISLCDGIWTNVDILFTGNGTAARPITLRAATHGRVHLTGTSRLRIAGTYLVVEGLVFTNGYRTSGEVISFQDGATASTNARLVNCSVIDYNPPDLTSETRWVEVSGLSNRVEYCYFSGKANAGSTIAVIVGPQTNSPGHHVIARNYFGFRPPVASGEGETILIGTAEVSLNAARTVVEDNYFERCSGDAEIISNKSGENVFRHNTFYECEGALSLRHGNGCVVEANSFLGNRKLLTGGVRVVGDNHLIFNNYFAELLGTSSRAPMSIMQGLVDSPLNGYSQVHRATIAFNTFVNCTNSLVIGLSGTLSGSTNVTTLPPADCTVANNIVLQPAGRIVEQRIAPENFTWQSNLFFSTSPGITNDGVLRLNPQLAPGSGGIWRPLPGSPALNNAAGNFAFVSSDFEGHPRFARKDIGCDQAAAVDALDPPPGAHDTGPTFLRVAGSVVTWSAPASVAYGTLLSDTQLNASANTPGTFLYDPPVGTLLNAGPSQTLRVVFTPLDATEFNVVTQSVSIDVLPLTPRISWTNPAPITADTRLSAAQLNASSDVSGDFAYAPPAGTILEVGDSQMLAVTFTPGDTNNYEVTSYVVRIDVLRATPQVTWTTPLQIEQGTPLGAAQLDANASVPGEFVYQPPIGTILPAGAQTLRGIFTPADTGRYHSVTAAVTIEITRGGKRVPAVEWATPTALLAGAPLGEEQLSAAASVPGRFEYTPPAGTILPVGIHTLTANFIPAESTTFASVTRSVVLEVRSLSNTPLVRVAYVIPANRAPQAHAVSTLRSTMALYQRWLAVQMERNGFGPKKFLCETEPDGLTPQIHLLPLPQSDAYLRGDANGARVLSAVKAAGLPIGAPGQIWWLVPETHVQLADGEITGGFQAGKQIGTDTGWALLGSDQLVLLQESYHTNVTTYDGVVIPELGPYPLVNEISFPWYEGFSLSAVSSSAIGGGLHALGQALGLDPDYRNDENFNGNVMGFGFRGIRGVFYPKLFPYNFCALSYASALALDVSPFLNPGRASTDTNAPAVTIQTDGARIPNRGLLEISFAANDDQALHAALLTWESGGEMPVVEEMGLNGTSAARTFAIPYFNNDETNRYRITVFDRQGNRTSAETLLLPHGNNNRSPQPFITVRPLVTGIGQDMVMDASATFDSEHATELLEVEWDLDGDGFFDTDPTTSHVFTNQYFTLGTHVIRARITDPAGAVAVSAPVAVSTIVCLTELSPLTRFHGFAGSTGIIEVTVGPKCQWTVENTNDWVVIRSDAFGAGPGQVIYDVLPNPNFTDREGTLLIGDERFLVRQHALECSVSISPASRFHGFGTGGNSFKVNTKAGCNWTAINTNPWITITSDASSVGTGTVTYALAENRVSGRRSGNIVVGADVFTVNQWGTNCEWVLSLPGRSHSENAETGTVTVTTASGCAWKAETTNDWIALSGVGAGTNTAALTYTVAPNASGLTRIGEILVNGLVFSITQRPCSYAVSPLSQVHGFLGQTGSVLVTAGTPCPWQVTNTNAWLSIIDGVSGTGPGTVTYAVTENPRGEPRVATFTVAGVTTTVIQSGKPCLFTIAPEEFAIGESGGTGEVSIAADAGCPWRVEKVPSWISIIAGASGEGPGLVRYAVTPNTGGPRSALFEIAGQDFGIAQRSAVRPISIAGTSFAGGTTNCVDVQLGALGGERSLQFSLCYDTNFLRYRSARLPSGNWRGATLTVTTNDVTQGRVGFTVALPAGITLTAAAPASVQVCLSAAAINGRAATPLSICDLPVPRRLADVLGQTLPVSYADAAIEIVGYCSLAESLDANFNWQLSSATAWRCTTNVTHDGVDAAEVAPVADGDDAYFESTFQGPGMLTFWWKVSSEADNDRLRFYLDGDEQFRISGEIDWEWRSINLASGSHTARWRYSKSSSGVNGADRGWVDEVVYMPAAPVITSHPANRSVDEGTTTSFSVSATGQAPLSYQWLRNGNALSDSASVRGSRTATLTLSNVTPPLGGLYSVIVGNNGGSVASAPASLLVTPAVSLLDALDATNLTWTTSGNAAWIGQAIQTHDGADAARSGAITHSQSASIETTVLGPGTVSFWWRVSSEPSNDRVAFFINGTEQARLSGEVEWQLRTFNVATGSQTLRWTYSKNSSTSSGEDRAWVDEVEFVPAPVTISAHPVSRSVDPGATITFNITASGAPPVAYQWQHDGIDLRGATGASLTLSNVTSADAGTYAARVSNPAGSVTSSNAILQVTEIVSLGEALEAPTLTWITNRANAWVGQTSTSHDGEDAARSGALGNSQTNTLSTVVTGPGTLSFWWKVSSETNDRLRLVINNTEQFSIGGEIGWNWRQVSVGSGSNTVQWRYTKNSSSTGGEDRGWVDEAFFVPTNGTFAPLFALQPPDRTVVAPAMASFNAVAIGSQPLRYQWLFNGEPLANATTTNLTLSPSAASMAGDYALVAENAAGRATSAVARLTVISTPVITNQPTDENLVAGDTASFDVGAIGTSPLAFQWRFNDTNLGNSSAVSGTTSNVLRVANAASANVGEYMVVITNSAGSVTSRTARLVISTLPRITESPVSQTVALDGTATFSVQANGSAPLRYQWRFNGASLPDSPGVMGATTTTLRLNEVPLARAGIYSVVVSNAVGFVTSSNATLTVVAPPIITTQPISQIVGEGTNVSFVATATGATPLTYRWRFNGTNLVNTNGIAGATTTKLTLSNVQPSQSGAYALEAVNAGGASLSADAQLTVMPRVSLGEALNAPYLEWTTSPGGGWIVQTNVAHDGEAAAQSGAITNGGSSWIETRVIGPGTLRFWWKVSSQTNNDPLSLLVNGLEVARISGLVDWRKVSLELPPGDLTLRWMYSKDLTVLGGMDRAWVDEVDFIPNHAPAPPVIVSQPVGMSSVIPGSTVTFAAQALGTAPLSYQWRFEGRSLSDGLDVIGANSPTVRLFNVRNEQAGLYDVVVRNAYGQAISTQVFLTVFTTVPLNVALDTERTNLLWFTGGYSPWIGQTTESKDQFDAAQSSPLPNNTSNWVQTTLPFPCALTFWWKVSSQADRDSLRFLVNGTEQARISGEVGWRQVSFPILTNGARVRWEYRKDSSGSAGLDRAWLDRIELLAISPYVTNSAPDTNIVEQGTTVRFRVEAGGTQPFQYQWRRNGTNLVEATNVLGAMSSGKLILSNAQPSQSGLYTCEVANEAGSHESEQMYLRVNSVSPFPPGLDTPSTWVWETGGYSWWVLTTSDSHDGVDAARTTYVDDGHTAWMRTSLEGPGTLTYWWSASTQPNADFLRFRVNNVVQAQISGSVGWQQKIVTLGEGTSVLQWEYAKDALLTNGADRVWVDQVSYKPFPPVFTNQPVPQAIDVGSTIIVSAAAKGVGPLSYRWRYNGTPLNNSSSISGATTPVLRIANAQTSNSGAYSVVVTNLGGATTSAVAQVSVTPVLPLATALDTTNLVWVTGTPPWVGQPLVSHDGVDAARSPMIGHGQSASMQATLTGPGTLTFWWKASSELVHDVVWLAIDGVYQGELSGETAWDFASIEIPDGDHVVRWTYEKDSANSVGQDRAWVDQIAFRSSRPKITLHPVSQRVEEGQRVTFTAASAGGDPPITYQWRFNGTALIDGTGISGARTTTLIISNAQPSRAGSYAFEATGDGGTVTSSNALLTVTPLVSLAAALDAAGLAWTTNGSPSWVGQTIVTHDGVDAARSGATANNSSNSMQTVVTGPGTLSFWWKVSSEPNNDRLVLFTNGVEQSRISGEVDWQFKSINVGAGTQTLRWTYLKNGSAASGQDRGWVDDIRFGVFPPTITVQPQSVGTNAGKAASFSVSAVGTAPITYQWLFNGTPLANGNGVSGATTPTLTISSAQAAQVGAYKVVVANNAGAITSAVASLALWPTMAEALDAPQLTFTVGGTGQPWTGRFAPSHDGQDAAESGVVTDSTYTWIKTTVTGPGVLRFWWAASTEENHDWLRLMMDMADQTRISGEVDWQQVTFNVPSGVHELQWRYSKNSSLSAGLDRVWLDQVSFSTNFTAPAVLAPLIELQPVSAAIDENQTVEFTVSVLGAAPLQFQWFFNGLPLVDGGNVGGSTTAGLTILNASAAQAGEYQVVITNSYGATASRVARLGIDPILALAESLDMPEMEFLTDLEAPWQGQRAVTHDGVDAARVIGAADEQRSSIRSIIDGPGELSFWWKVSSETNGDVLQFTVNDIGVAAISGEVEWQQRSVSLGAGPQLLNWTYLKNGSGREGEDRAWLDQVSFVRDGFPAAPEPPTQVMSPRITVTGNTAQLTWVASPGRKYRVEYKVDLDDAEWKVVESEVLHCAPLEMDTAGATCTATVDDLLSPRTRFYRVLEF